MNVAKKVQIILKEQGRTQKWLYEQIISLVKIEEGENLQVTGYKNFNRKMIKDKLTAQEIIYIMKVLEINVMSFFNLEE
ncbi:hypothetical protein [Senegalia massiliensis]|uniref:XRE family transcriptional regulator n=1 Tax=Senegalia massiliensis TaxID=1720316 RepID=A0A845QYI6_9CLOT|nr:hypothetical protein [Senegalia massiliensis]NBI07545.1 hypothetical protein [Senegalia massiliensis]